MNCPVAAWPRGLEADFSRRTGGSHGESRRNYFRFLCTFFIRLVFFFIIFSVPFGLFPFTLTAEPLQLREVFAITYF